jgi:hypothetical protein
LWCCLYVACQALHRLQQQQQQQQKERSTPSRDSPGSHGFTQSMFDTSGRLTLDVSAIDNDSSRPSVEQFAQLQVRRSLRSSLPSCTWHARPTSLLFPCSLHSPPAHAAHRTRGCRQICKSQCRFATNHGTCRPGKRTGCLLIVQPAH